MNQQLSISAEDLTKLPVVRAGDRRCPYCQSSKWVHLEGSKTLARQNPETGADETVMIPNRYGCENCAGEFFVEGALAWKRATDMKRCPHCGSRRVIAAIRMPKGAVIACKQCNNLGLFEHPGFEGKISVEDVKAAGRLTEEAQEFFGGRGFQFDLRRAKAQRNAAGSS